MAKKPKPQEGNEAHLVDFLRRAREDTPTEFMGTPMPGGAGESVTVTLKSPMIPRALQKLSHLERLGLLREEVLFSVIAAAPIDEHRVLRALRTYLTHWTFEASTCSVIAILAKERDAPVALMRLDLLTDDIIYVARQAGQLVEVEKTPAEETLALFNTPGITPDQAWGWFQVRINRTIDRGLKG